MERRSFPILKYKGGKKIVYIYTIIIIPPHTYYLEIYPSPPPLSIASIHQCEISSINVKHHLVTMMSNLVW